MIRWGDIGTGRIAHRSDHEPRRKRKRWLKTVPRAQIRGKILFPKPRSRRTTNQHNSPIVISNWRYFGNKGQQQKAKIGGKPTPFKQTSGETQIQLQQHKSPHVGRLRSASIGKGRRRLTRTSSMTPAGRVLICSFPPIDYTVLCILCYAWFCIVSCSLQFPMSSYQVLKAARIIL